MAFLSTVLRASVLSLLSLQALGLVLQDSLPGVPAGWSLANTPNDDSTMVLQVALTLQNLDQLESKLASVSTPDSPSYGKYLSADEVSTLFGASETSSKAVTSWLESSGVSTYKVTGNSVWFKSTVAQANSLLGTTFHNYVDSTGTTKLRTTKYSIPEALVEHVATISPTTYFSKTKAHMAIPGVKKSLAPRALPASCNTTLVLDNQTYPALTPECLKIEYNVGGYTADPNSGSTIGFGSFLNQSASFSDLTTFEQYFDLPIQNFSVVLVNPQDNATDLPQPPLLANVGEANLDVQNIVSIAGGVPVTEFITAGGAPYFPDPTEPAGTPDENEPYLVYYDYLLSLTDAELPKVISNSYGDEEQTVPEDFAVQVCNLIGMLGLRGITVIHSSGDEGVGASCLSTDGTTPQFNPIFPATCPYVTSVGGTVSFEPEIAWDGSSGGFSFYFAQPWYQQDAIAQYLTNVSAETIEFYSQYTNFSGRGFPDTSAHSVHPDYSIFEIGVLTPDGGTSAAAPLTAGIVALLNDARLRAGLPQLGFLNPLLYSGGYKGFTDITSGFSVGCNGNDTQTSAPLPGAAVINPPVSWNATVGWDPVTGWGVPNFGALLELALQS